MSPRTVTAPPNHAGMWRRLLARAHPDAGGAHDLFVWTAAVREVVCGGELGAGIPRRRRDDDENRDRVPFSGLEDFEVLGRRAAAMAAEAPEPHARLLRLCAGCYPALVGPLREQQRRGATYKQLAYVAHLAGMNAQERRQWYQVAESVPLSQRHAGHLVDALQGRRVA